MGAANSDEPATNATLPRNLVEQTFGYFDESSLTTFRRMWWDARHNERFCSSSVANTIPGANAFSPVGRSSSTRTNRLALPRSRGCRRTRRQLLR